MGIEKSSECVLKISDGGMPASFLVIAGVQICSLKINSRIQDSTNLASGFWRKLTEKAGTRFITISANGIFTGSAGELIIREQAISGDKAIYKIDFAEGKEIRGEFIISEYKYSAKHELEQGFEITLESAGEITLV